VTGVTYGVAGEVLSLSGNLNETRTYNAQFQLTRITVPSVLDIQYVYPATNNNGKISSQTDVLSGEQITYTYDALNRLASAVTSDNSSVTQWGQSYTFDGFGNLTDQNVIKGSAPTMHVVYNASTNRQTTDTADLNGNIGSGYSYDIENRLLKAGTGMPQYGYDAGNKRIARDTEFTFWAGNQKWETYTTAVGGSSVTFTLTGVNVYFGGRLLAKGATHAGATSVAQDRLGSMNGKFYPFGQERPSATTNDKEKFTGYFRDSATGLDYADQRYEQPGQGRFMTPDPFGGSARLAGPGSWNRYAYTRGDPVNRRDPSGLDDDFSVTVTATLTAIDYDYSFDPRDSYNGAGYFGTSSLAALGFGILAQVQRDIARLVNSYSSQRLPEAKDLASKALSIDSCNKLLRGSGNIDPSSVLDSGRVSIDFSTGVSAAAETKGDFWNPRYSLTDGFYFGSASITINSSTYTGPNGPPSTFWNLGSSIDRATILVHELAHAIAKLQPGDVNGFNAPDGIGNATQQADNVQRINDECITPLKAITGLP